MSTVLANIFERAADRIQRSGFQKHGYYPGWSESDGRWSPKEIGEHIRRDNLKCCTLGAIYAESPDTGGMDASDRLAAHLGLSYGGAIPEWNDKPSQRKNRVVAALRRAAQKERETSE